MDLGLGNTLLAGDPRLVDHIVGEVKSQGIFDQFRKDCIADVDTKPAYQNLRTRVESWVSSFLSKQTWRADLNKNQLRETLRKHIHDAPYLEAGVERIVDQVVNPKVYSVFMPQIEDVVYKYLGMERPKNQLNGPFKDLLPKDLDPVSPESDKNSLKDVSLDSVDANMDDTRIRENEVTLSSDEKNVKSEKDRDKHSANNGHTNEEESSQDEIVVKPSLNNSGKSEDKAEEEEEDSPMFEPIDIMNLNESNISNDSHLSGISELTSHRSRSPDSSNETSRDNMDFSNQDSQLSKVSSDSRLSIVTDFGSSNHASTPVSDAKDEKDKIDGKYTKDNFKAVREFESGKGANKDVKSSYETSSSKEDGRGRRGNSSKETSRDGMENVKDSRENREKNRDGDSSRSKTTKDTKKDSKDSRKRSNNLSSESKNDKKRSKDKSESSRGNVDKIKDSSSKPKDDKAKDNVVGKEGKEGKDLKDIYKEKIRELREKKELTEKEKLNRDAKIVKDSKEKRDSSRESKKDSKDYKSSKSGSRSENRTKTSRSESRDKGKKDERKYAKDHKSRSNNGQGQSDSGDRSEGKRVSRLEKEEKDEKNEKSESKQDSKQKTCGKSWRADNGENKRDSKGEVDTREKKRRDDKKNKIKDDHSSLRKNTDDRRSTDRDGSNGSNGKNSQKNNSTTSTGSTRSVNTSLPKESTTTSNSSSEASDSVEEKQKEKLRIDQKSSENKPSSSRPDNYLSSEGESSQIKILEIGQSEISLPIKKRPMMNEGGSSADVLPKKPKFAKNFQEAKRLMKIRRRMEKEKRQLENEKNNESNPAVEIAPLKIDDNDLGSVPDEERVQIIEVRDEEYDEPYPEVQSDFTLEERSQIILGGESILTSSDFEKFKPKSTLSEMELSIRQSLNEMISDSKIKEINDASIKPQNSLESDSKTKTEAEESVVDQHDSNFSSIEKIDSPNDCSQNIKEELTETLVSSDQMVKTEIKGLEEDDSCTKDDPIVNEQERIVNHESLELVENDLISPEQRQSPKLEIVENNDQINDETSNALEIINEKIKGDETVDGESTNKEIVEESPKIEEKIIEPELSMNRVIENNNEETENNDEKIENNDEKIENNDEKIENKNEKIENNDEEAKNNDEKTESNEEIVKEESKVIENMEKRSETEMIGVNRVDEKMEDSVASTSAEIEKRAIKMPPKKRDKELRSRSIITSSDGVRNFGSEGEKEVSRSLSDDEGPCFYFVEDNERLEKFTKFMKSLESEDLSSEQLPADVLNNEIVSSLSKSMAPPKPKRKYSTSPLTDILLNNTNNNNDTIKIIEPTSDVEDGSNVIKKRKIGRPKKQKNSGSLCGGQHMSNGENFVMPLSPESDVSATSEKAPSNPLRDEKSRPRGSNQRYTSDDLYKPRPLFSSSSRRSRRSNPA